METDKRIKAISGMTPRQLRSYKAMLGFLNAIGITEENLTNLVDCASEWERFKEVANRNFVAMSNDISALSEQVNSLRKDLESGNARKKKTIMDDFNEEMEVLRPDGRKE